MAYAALASLAQTIDLILNHNQYSLSVEEKQQIKSIHDHAIHLQSFLENFPEKANSLEGRIRDAAYEAEDFIESLVLNQMPSSSGFATPHLMEHGLTEVKPHNHTSKSSVSITRPTGWFNRRNWKPVPRLVRNRFKTIFGVQRDKIDDRPDLEAANEAEDIPEWLVLDKRQSSHNLEKASKKIKSIVEQVITINNRLGINEKQLLGDSPAIVSSTAKLAPSHKDVMIGFDDDLKEIKDRLCGKSSNLQVISILGMGGIGKTNLARNAYDDQLIKEYFPIRAWVTISQDYSVQNVLSTLLVSMEGFIDDKPKQSNEEKVYKSLKGRRFLIIMDDMWSTKAWDEMRNIFPNDGIGSRIILTTRLSDVASYPNLHSSIYEMHFLTDEQSWNLLHLKVFAQQDCPPELENIGKEIARSCKGLPLAIVVVAGLLSTISMNPASWGEIAKKVNSVVAEKDGEFEEILSLSYTHLPHHLRPCFLYLGAFPEDHEVRVSKLIKLWIAEGFLKYPNGTQSLEEKAYECLENLVRRSLVFITKKKSNGKIKSCSLHDLMRDLCIRKAQEEEFLVNIRDGYSADELFNQRRISVVFSVRPYSLKTYGLTIRTLIWFLYASVKSVEHYTLLRVLNVVDADVTILTDQLFELIHLRYLAINYCGSIDTTISQLQNLQTLIIRARGQWKLRANHYDCLPKIIWSMPQLRHLSYYGTLPNPEGSTSTLENLQTLVFSGHTTEAILKAIPNLRKLKINCYSRTYLNNLECLHLLESIYLECLHLLESLEIRSHNYFEIWEKGDFNFPRMLKKLTLSGLRFSWDEMRVVCSLPNLQVLKLKDHACRGSTWETAEEEFPELEYLLIEGSYLEYWITESSHFPMLKSLFIHNCWRLSEIPDGIGEINTLELIEIKGHVKKSLVESAQKIQKELHDLGNDDLQVRCITH